MFEYRVNSLVQIGAMVLNDVVVIIAFFLIFSSMGTVNGYGFRETAMLTAIALVGIGFAGIMAGAYSNIYQHIINGTLDTYLSMPINELFHVLISKLEPDNIGDFVLGIALFIILKIPLGIGILAALSCCAAYLGLSIAINTIAFFSERPYRAVRAVRHLLFSFPLWPSGLVHVPTKIAMIVTLLAFITLVPVSVILEPSLTGIAVMIFGSAITFLFGIVTWKRGLRRYESGNLVGMRG